MWIPYFKSALVMLMAVGTALAQAQAWPTQTVRIVVPFTPGTGMDTIARTVQPRLAERLGQPVVVVNTPGASGNIGADAVAKASPDGYTVLMGANTMLMASQVYKNVPFDPIKDFLPVSLTAWGTLMLVASPKSGITSVPDLVARSKARPGSVTFGSPGMGTPHHLAMELFKAQTNAFMLHVPYRGSSGYIQDILSGELMVGFLPVHIAQNFVAAGKLTALAVGSPKRHPVSPSVATFEELGVKGVEVDLWYAFFAPSQTPAAVVNRLNIEIAAILTLPEVHDVLGKTGLAAATSTPDELMALLLKDYARWGAVIKRTGISVD